MCVQCIGVTHAVLTLVVVDTPFAQPTLQRQSAVLFMVMLDRVTKRALEVGEYSAQGASAGGGAASSWKPLSAQELMAAIVSYQKGRCVTRLSSSRVAAGC